MKRTSFTIDDLQKSVPQEIKNEVDLEFDISSRIYDLMQSRGLSKSEFASSIGCRPSEVTKWLCGQHNFTIRTLAKLSAFFGEPLVSVCGAE